MKFFQLPNKINFNSIEFPDSLLKEQEIAPKYNPRVTQPQSLWNHWSNHQSKPSGWGPGAKSSPPPAFVKKMNWNIAPPISSYITHGCFHVTTTQLSCCGRGCMAGKSSNIYYFDLYRKKLVGLCCKRSYVCQKHIYTLERSRPFERIQVNPSH